MWGLPSAGSVPARLRSGPRRPPSLRAWSRAWRGSDPPRRSRRRRSRRRRRFLRRAPARARTSAASSSSPTAAHASVRYVSEASQSDSRNGSRPCARIRASSWRASSSMPSSTSSATRPGRQAPPRAVAPRKHADQRGELSQPALLPADREGLDAVEALGVAAAEQARQLTRALRPGFGLLQVTFAQRDRRPEVLGYKGMERLLRAVR